jgi:hypothetical protein
MQDKLLTRGYDSFGGGISKPLRDFGLSPLAVAESPTNAA